MSYYSGFVLAVPTANKEAYAAFARKHWPMFKRYGALRIVENWGVDVPDGKLTDFRKSVQATAEETVVMSWMEWPDRATCDAAWAKLMEDPDMAALGHDMPFDGKRMFWGGFEPMFDSSAE
jgi:uncharacterized protein YbaA (DUF1428 family)